MSTRAKDIRKRCKILEWLITILNAKSVSFLEVHRDSRVIKIGVKR
jgi:hypothetical protein